MKVVVFGATGMVGQGVVRECLSASAVDSVLVVGRRTSGTVHPKVREILRTDFFDYTDVGEQLAGYDACFFCLGVSAFRMAEKEYHRLTYELTMRAAETLARLNPDMVFCYVSGAGTDRTERGRMMWARVKGKTENELLRLPFKAAYMFRPAFIQPQARIVSRTPLYRVFYAVTRPMYPVLGSLLPSYVTTTQRLARAMIRVAREGYARPVLENTDINALAP